MLADLKLRNPDGEIEIIQVKLKKQQVRELARSINLGDTVSIIFETDEDMPLIVRKEDIVSIKFIPSKKKSKTQVDTQKLFQLPDGRLSLFPDLKAGKAREVFCNGSKLIIDNILIGTKQNSLEYLVFNILNTLGVSFVYTDKDKYTKIIDNTNGFTIKSNK